jgi:hypothetical protein
MGGRLTYFVANNAILVLMMKGENNNKKMRAADIVKKKKETMTKDKALLACKKRGVKSTFQSG